MECVLKGIVRYDGTDFAGWQRQPGQRTVQGELEAALSRIANQPVAIQGAGRTDAGVHALGQVFSCRWPVAFAPRMRHALSQMAGPEIRILSLETAPPEFNARFSARGKRYIYSFEYGPEADPLARRYAWHVPFPVDIATVQSLLPKLEGKHDFAAFQSVGNQMENTVRTLHAVRMYPGALLAPPDLDAAWRIEFVGDGFLYHMVRNLVGTLVEIGRGRFPAAFLTDALDGPGPFKGHCAPAHGLVLAEVFYDDTYVSTLGNYVARD